MKNKIYIPKYLGLLLSIGLLIYGFLLTYFQIEHLFHNTNHQSIGKATFVLLVAFFAEVLGGYYFAKFTEKDK